MNRRDALKLIGYGGLSGSLMACGSGSQAHNVKAYEVISGIRGANPLTIESSQFVIVRDCEFEGINDSSAITIRDSSFIRIEGNIFRDCAHAGVVLDRSVGSNVDIVIAHNRFENCQTAKVAGNAAVQARANLGTTKNDSNVSIHDNYFINSGAVSIGLDACDSVVVSQNEIRDSNNEGIAVTGRNITIVGNHVVMPQGQITGACVLLWADTTDYMKNIAIRDNYLEFGTNNSGQCIAIVPHGPDQVISDVIISGNILLNAQNAVQGYEDGNPGPSGTYGADGVLVTKNDIIDCPSQFNMLPWPVRNVEVTENTFM